MLVRFLKGVNLLHLDMFLGYCILDEVVLYVYVLGSLNLLRYKSH